jgi:hypothetical protein
MALAASLVFIIGAAGGFVARAATPTWFAANAPVPVTDLSAMERRVQTHVLADIAGQVHPVSMVATNSVSATPAAERAELMQHLEGLIATSQNRETHDMLVRMNALFAESDRQRRVDLDTFQRQITMLESTINVEIASGVAKELRQQRLSQPAGDKKEK